jgi:hypothetical protein
MPGGERHPVADVAIVARASADELRFEARPHTATRFPGIGERDAQQTTTKRNLDSPVQVGRTYRRVFAATWIRSRLIEDVDAISGHAGPGDSE